MSSRHLPAEPDEQRRALVRKLLERRGVRPSGDEGVPRRPAGQAAELSLPQRRLWFLHQLQPSAAYNLAAAFALSGRLDVAALERAIDGIVARHDALRMAFPTINGEGAVEMATEARVKLPLLDLSRLAPEARQARLDASLRSAANEPFDIARWPLFRVVLVRLAPNEHVLGLTAHHIVFDGWSIVLFIRELSAGYAAALEGRTPDLPPLAIDYADFAAWQCARLRRSAFDADLAYWTGQLADLPRLELPADHPRPPRPTFRGGSRAFTVSAELTAQLRRLAQDQQATLFMVLLTGFFAWLQRYTGRTDLAVGSPIAGRSRPELEPLIGLFANTLVLRADLGGEPSFVEVLARVRRMTLDAYARQEAPFECLVERLQPERRLGQQPLFQTAFAMQSEGLGALALPDLDVHALPPSGESSKFDLTVALTDEGNALSGSAEFSLDLFEPDTIDRMLGHYQRLLAAAVRLPNGPVASLPMLASAERDALLRPTLDEPARPAVAERLHETFERRARAMPDELAIVARPDSLTYGELNAGANRLARRLRRLGVRAEDRVGLYLDRSSETIVAILAVLKAGAAYVPIDPANPAERIGFILDDAGVRLLLTDRARQALLPPLPVPRLLLDEAREEIASEDGTDLGLGGDPRELAYIIYTSGSTGRPKGTLVQHDHVQRLFTATDQWFGFGPDDVWTLFHSFGFDFSVWELWGALRYGGRLVLVPYLVSRTPGAFYELVAEEGVTVLSQTPSAFHQFVDAEEHGGRRPLALRWVVFGGEALDFESLRPWFERHGDEQPRLVNMYGITETTVHVTYRPIRKADLDHRVGSVLGAPIPDLRLVLLDAHLEPVPRGVPGEIFVGGAGVARGYWNQAGLTAERFVPDPFGAPGGRLYRSGDLARFASSGELEYLGRIDHQVKIRGFRIELGEIEGALAAHSGVRGAIVVPRQGDGGARQGDGEHDARLVAYVTANEGVSLSPSALRTHLKARLPDYMLPSAYVVLDGFPLTPNGKIDRRALPAPPREAAPVEEADEPRSEAEQVLAGIWQEVLGVARVGVRDNFFELGGDSILSIKVLARARERGVEIALPQLFEHQTIAGILASGLSSDREPARVPTAPFALVAPGDVAAIAGRFGDGAVDAYPLTRLQEGMLFHGAFNEASKAYHNVSSFHLRVQVRSGGARVVARPGDGASPVLADLTSSHRLLPSPAGRASTGADPRELRGPARVVGGRAGTRRGRLAGP